MSNLPPLEFHYLGDNQLKCYSSPLFSSVDCVFSIEGVQSEIYVFTKVTTSGRAIFNMECMSASKSVGGHNCYLPFDYEQLYGVLKYMLPDDDLLHFLELKSVKMLINMGLSLEQVFTVSAYASRDYPVIYLFVVAVNNKNGLLLSENLTREILASSLNYSGLSNGQLSAMRALDVEGACDVKAIGNAVGIVVNDWVDVKAYVSHIDFIQVDKIILLNEILRSYPEIKNYKWFSYKNLCYWVNSVDELDFLGLNEKTIAIIFLLQWKLINKFESSILESRDANLSLKFNKATVNSTFEDYLDTIESVVDLGYENVNSIFFKMLDSIVGECYYVSKKYKNNSELPNIWGLSESEIFKRVATVGALRDIAGKMGNCAADFIQHCVNRKIEFWQYLNPESNEFALLSIETTSNLPKIKEIKTYGNKDVSEMCEARCHDWICSNTA